MTKKQKSKKLQAYNLKLPYINDKQIAIKLTVNNKRPVKIEIDHFNTTVKRRLAEVLLSDLHFVVRNKNERDEITEPVVAEWIKGDKLIAACLDKKYKVKEAVPGEIEDPLEDIIEISDPDRLICWWPDPMAWEEMDELLKTAPVEEITLPFFTFREFFKRPDIAADVKRFTKKISRVEKDPGKAEKKIRRYKSNKYSKYIHKLKTVIFFAKKNNVNVKITVGNVEEALEFFKKENMNALDIKSWAAAADIFQPMGKYMVEEEVINPILSLDDIKAVIYGLSHMPKIAPEPDAVRIITFADQKPVFSTVIWFNPADVEVAQKESSDIIIEEIERLGIKEVYFEENFLNFETLINAG